MKNTILFVLLLFLMIAAITCKKYDSNNPADSSVVIPAPTSLEITAFTDTNVTLNWKRPAPIPNYPNESIINILIEQSADGGANWLLLDSVEANISTKIIAGVYRAGITYSFRVSSVSLNHISAPSAIASGRIDRISVDGGTFQMGSTTATANEWPVHVVTVGSFYMDKNEVTYEKWMAVQSWGETHGYTDIEARGNGSPPIYAKYPVTGVNWYDVVKWCNARSEMENLTPVYYTSGNFVPANIYKTGANDLQNSMVNWRANGYRLPTEAEWEFAARGGTKSANYTYSGSHTIDNVAWYHTNSSKGPQPGGLKAANELGLHDMSGNVREWCWDWRGTYPVSVQTDPKGPSEVQTWRVIRGGSFYDDEIWCRAVLRCYAIPIYSVEGGGFRCVQN